MTRSATAPSLPMAMEDPVTEETSEASAAVVTEAELALDTVLPRLRPVARSLARSASQCPDRSAGQ